MSSSPMGKTWDRREFSTFREIFVARRMYRDGNEIENVLEEVLRLHGFLTDLCSSDYSKPVPGNKSGQRPRLICLSVSTKETYEVRTTSSFNRWLRYLIVKGLLFPPLLVAFFVQRHQNHI